MGPCEFLSVSVHTQLDLSHMYVFCCLIGVFDSFDVFTALVGFLQNLEQSFFVLNSLFSLTKIQFLFWQL
jgi:hypothetical protein|tara:strand:- start:4742 stop:4951 length:210 start_codon:yes stop_codon:yes gene_type:complete